MFYLGPKFGTLINMKWITISELLQELSKKTKKRNLKSEGVGEFVITYNYFW
jgi:hypothetical protein